MMLRLSHNDGKYHVYSIALNENSADELKSNELSYWLIENKKIFDGKTGSEIPYISDDPNILSEFNDFDVVEVFDDGRVYRYYDDSREDTVLFITEKCNSNCIMCPSPELSRRRGDSWAAEQLIDLADHIPSDARHFTITGGEPFMLGKSIFKYLAFLKNKFTDSEFLFLTNGRALAINSYLQMIQQNMPYNTIFGIPLHASAARLHDFITQSAGSFDETVTGIENLLRIGASVELRIVVTKLNALDLEDLASFSAAHFPNLDHVSIMAAEMTGNAYMKREDVWIPYRESFRFVKKAINIFIRNSIDVRLYNYPLCTVDPEYWTLCRKSISENKIRYCDCCKECRAFSACGGMFSGSIRYEESEVKPL